MSRQEDHFNEDPDGYFGIDFFDDPVAEDKEHEAYLKYRSGEISRAEWSRVLMHGFDLDSYTPKKLPWWKRIFKGRSFA